MQLSLLFGEDIRTRREANLESEIEETAKEVHSRLEYLFEDVALFYSGGFLGQDSDTARWELIENITRNDPLYDMPSMVNGAMPKTLSYMDLAINFGHLCRLLYSDAPEYDEEKIAMGFLIGLTGGWMKDDPETSSSQQKTTQSITTDDTKIKYFKMPSNETFQDLRSLLSDANNSVQERSLEIPEQKELRVEIEKSKLTLTPSLFSHAENKFLQSPYNGVREIVPNLVANLESNKDLKKAETVAEQIEKDINELFDLSWRGGLGIDIFSAVGSEQTTEVADDICLITGSKDQQTRKLINDLAGRSTPWTKRPLIKDGKKEIELTVYGSFIYQLMPSEQDDLHLTQPSSKTVFDSCHNAILNKSESKTTKKIYEIATELYINKGD